MKIEKIKRQLESVFNEIYYYTNVAGGDGPLEILNHVVDEYELSDVYDKWLENRDAEDEGTEIPHPQAVDDAERLLEAFEDALEQCQFEFEEYPEFRILYPEEDTDMILEDEDEEE